MRDTRTAGVTIETTPHSFYVGRFEGGGGLWIEHQQPHLACLWSIRREPGSVGMWGGVEVWAGPIYAVLDWMPAWKAAVEAR